MRIQENVLSFSKIALIPGFIVAISTVLALWILPVSDPLLALGITYDLVLLAPAVYLWIIWKRPIPKITAVPIFILSVLYASVIIPEDFQGHLDVIKNIGIPIVEFVIIGFIIIKTRTLVKAYGRNKNRISDFYQVLQQSSSEVLESNRIGNVFATEIAMISYGLFFWKKVERKDNQFTAYQENAFIATFIAILCILLIETGIVHYLLLKWNSIIAWILLVLSLYSGLQLLGHIKAVKRRFTEVRVDSIDIKYGLFGDVTIPKIIIDSIVKSDKTPEDKKSFHQMARLGELEAHNLIIELKEPVTVRKAYGFTKKTKKILLHLDQPDDFISMLVSK